jgi:hypothetical protein
VRSFNFTHLATIPPVLVTLDVDQSVSCHNLRSFGYYAEVPERCEIRVRSLPPTGARETLRSISAALCPMHDEPVNEINPDFDALLIFLANWEAIERSALGRILTAGQLADVQELERLYALPSAPENQPASDI